jgi:hypothetical protein
METLTNKKLIYVEEKYNEKWGFSFFLLPGLAVF